MLNVSVIILAGGKSSRMGQNKALIKFNDQTLLENTYQVAESISKSVYIVSPWSEKYQQILPSSCQFVEEQTPFFGPLIAFYQGLLHIKTEWVLLLACDLPFLDIKEMKTWLSFLPDVNPKAIAFLAKNKKGWEVLCGFYRRNSLTSLEKFISQGGNSFQKWLKNNLVESIPIQNKKMFFNCNTPNDLQQMQND